MHVKRDNAIHLLKLKSGSFLRNTLLEIISEIKEGNDKAIIPKYMPLSKLPKFPSLKKKVKILPPELIKNNDRIINPIEGNFIFLIIR